MLLIVSAIVASSFLTTNPKVTLVKILALTPISVRALRCIVRHGMKTQWIWRARSKISDHLSRMFTPRKCSVDLQGDIIRVLSALMTGIDPQTHKTELLLENKGSSEEAFQAG
jgi:hypothetical protein